MDHLDTVISSIGGAGVMVLLARLVFGRIFGDIAKLSEELRALGGEMLAVSKELAVIAVRFERVADHEMMLKEHEREIADLKRGGNRGRDHKTAER